MIRTVAVMGTIVTIQMVADARDSHIIDRGDSDEAVERALDWFRRVEACCSRFDPHSELMQLSAQIGLAVPVSEMLFEVVQFALAVAEETAGAFDPTVGREMETRGFNREHRTRKIVRTPLESGGDACYRDVALDPDHQTITLLRPLILDLGAVAKGFAIDMAARELRPFEDFAINAGGDLYLGGRSPDGTPWSIGIRHPRRDRHLIASVARPTRRCAHRVTTSARPLMHAPATTFSTRGRARRRPPSRALPSLRPPRWPRMRWRRRRSCSAHTRGFGFSSVRVSRG